MDVTVNMDIIEILKACMDRALTEFYTNKEPHSNKVLEENILFWARIGGLIRRDNGFRTKLCCGLHRELQHYNYNTISSIMNAICDLECIDEYKIREGLYSKPSPQAEE